MFELTSWLARTVRTHLLKSGGRLAQGGVPDDPDGCFPVGVRSGQTSGVGSGRFGRIFCTRLHRNWEKFIFLIELCTKDASGSSGVVCLKGVGNMRPDRPGLATEANELVIRCVRWVKMKSRTVGQWCLKLECAEVAAQPVVNGQAWDPGWLGKSGVKVG